MITVYHGTSLDNMELIIKNGFDSNKIGTGWGTTYGNGIYLALDPNIANLYSGNTGIVLEVTIKYNPYKLLNSYKPNNKKHIKSLAMLKHKVIEEGYTCFVSPNNEEIILFDISDIVSIGYYSLF